MQVLSLFDGISCGQVALNRAGFTPSAYYASEIDKSAIEVTMRNWPKTIQLGDIRKVVDLAANGIFKNIDLLMGGSPCQGFSNAGLGKGFDDPRSKLLIEFLFIKLLINPRYFLLENVKMKPKDVALVSTYMGCDPVEINSNKFSAQDRKRLYWTNIPIAPIVDREIIFPYIRQWNDDDVREYAVNKTPSRIRMWGNGQNRNNGGTCFNLGIRKKSGTLTIKQDRSPNAGLIPYGDFCRYLSHVECERLQTLPDDYTFGSAKSARYRHLGNGWTVDVIAHIMRGMQP